MCTKLSWSNSFSSQNIIGPRSAHGGRTYKHIVNSAVFSLVSARTLVHGLFQSQTGYEEVLSAVP